jgi:hypothetical protein
MEQAIPILPADDLSIARAFYVDGLGFSVTFDLLDPFGNTIFVMGPVTA